MDKVFLFLAMLAVGGSFGLFMWLSTLVARLHYRIKDTDAPLFINYAIVFLIIWAVLALGLLILYSK